MQTAAAAGAIGHWSLAAPLSLRDNPVFRLRKLSMNLRIVLMGAFAILCACLVPATALAGSPIMTNDEGAANMMMQAFGKAKPGEHYQVTFLDAKGKKLDFAAFTQSGDQGQRFVIETNTKAHTAIWKLLPQGAAPKGSFSFKSRPSPTAINTGSPFPPFDLPLVAGGTLSSTSLRGKPWLIDFFFAECVPCIKELPALNAYAKRHPDQRMVAVTFDDKATAQAFVKKWHPAWPVAYAGQRLIDQAGISAYPTLALIGADGRVLDVRISTELPQHPKDTLTAQDIERWVSAKTAAMTQPRTH
ncbi:MAG: TlpA family protein disulfide reductase [Proteobacteria bacterium]|nr:TlpA family protein disulfide reductase [Pseudomonadota bacterium]